MGQYRCVPGPWAEDDPICEFDRGECLSAGSGILGQQPHFLLVVEQPPEQILQRQGRVGELAGADVADWLSGLLIGREIRDALAWARANGAGADRVRIIGSDALAARYATALRQAGIDAERGASDTAARGLWRIAGQAGLIH